MELSANALSYGSPSAHADSYTLRFQAFDKEALEIMPRERPKPPGELYDILGHIYREGAAGQRPTLTQVRGGLSLSKPTTAKRVMSLVRTGHLALSRYGRTKRVELTEKGRRAFLK